MNVISTISSKTIVTTGSADLHIPVVMAVVFIPESILGLNSLLGGSLRPLRKECAMSNI